MIACHSVIHTHVCVVCAYLYIHWIVNIIVAIETEKNKQDVCHHKNICSRNLKRLYYVDLDEGYGPGNKFTYNQYTCNQ